MNTAAANVQPLNPSGLPASGLRLCVADNLEDLSRMAADVIAAELRAKPDLLLCAATGATPTRTYEWLVARQGNEPSLFRSLRVLKLDEWGGLPMDAPGSCESYLQRHLVGPLEIPADRYLSFQSEAEPAAECARVAAALEREGPIDLCVLGLGLNGHLGFNEPAEALPPLPHRAELSASSLRHPMIQGAAVPISYGLTLGMAHLLQARKILLLVNGAHKAPAMGQLLAARISTRFPASFLWLHPDVRCLCDRAAVADSHRPAA